MIPRIYNDLTKFLKPNSVLLIYGPRQVGKTTLLKQYLAKTSFKYKEDVGDNIRVQEIVGSQNFNKILEYVSGYDLIALDEAQRIPNIGMGLKIIVDQAPGIRVIATGSSSFELAGQVGEPLTGRKRTLHLFPVSQLELRQQYNIFELKERLPEWLVWGGYPAVLNAPTTVEKKRVLEEIMEAYLLKDILELEQVKSAKLLLDLLRLVAFQVGNEVSLSELGAQLGIEKKTVARYLDLFEKAFVLINVRGFSRNLRKEITKKSKYYFYDTGMRNAVIANFNPLEIRNDVGALWENFLVVERLKAMAYKEIYAHTYFWRTWDKKELDWVEEREGKLFGYEFKFSPLKQKIPKTFLDTYPGSVCSVIHQDNYLAFVGIDDGTIQD